MAKVDIDLDKSPYDLTTYMGRAQHFLRLTNPLNILATESQLDEAERVVTEFKKTKAIPSGYNETTLWKMKYLYDSAYHPDTGKKMFVLGRMAAQAPMNTLITGCMITFYKTTPAVVFWQWTNQTFNAGVNYTNRSGDAPLSTTQLLQSYVAACTGALGTALYLNKKASTMSPIYGRLVPFVAVSAANFINIPMMRSSELLNGTPVYADNGKRLGDSTKAARNGIFLVCISRILMAVPGMTLTPFITNIATQRGLFCNNPKMVIPFQLGLVGICVTFATPLCCALFQQTASINVSDLESPLKEQVTAANPKLDKVFFNKGL